MQSLVGSLLWLSNATRPDLSTITSILSKYTSNPTPAHIRAAKHAIRYVKGTKTRGIMFSSLTNASLSAYLHFPVDPASLLPVCDANWGGQDQSIPNPAHPVELPLFKSRSISGFIILHNGPIHWISRRQKITARSSAEAEIYATDECVKGLLRLQHLIKDCNVSQLYMPTNTPLKIYNDNNACVCWAKGSTTKGLRHLTIRENAVRESVQKKTISVHHIEGSYNIADKFTKEL